MRLTCHRREEGLVCGNVCLNQRVVEKGGGCVTAVYEWIRNLVAFFLFLSVMENLLPGQKHITILQQVQTQHIRIMRCNMLLYLKYSVKNALSFSNGMMSI